MALLLLFQVGFKGYGLSPDTIDVTVPFIFEGQEYTLKQGSVVLAAITSCTNTSNPSVMLGAGTVTMICNGRMYWIRLDPSTISAS